MSKPSPVYEIIIDTREQTPLTGWGSDVRLFRGKLDTGDYSIKGLESEICVERKSLSDWLSTIFHGQERFRNELLRMQSYAIKVIVVEASYRTILSGNYGNYSRANPSSVASMAASIFANYGVSVVYCDDAHHARDYTERLLKSYARKITRKEFQQLQYDQQDAITAIDAPPETV